MSSASDQIIGWPQNAYVGQKVVCVDADGCGDGYAPWDEEEAPENGRVYTITRIYIDVFGGVAFWLAEISRSAASQRDWDGQAGYGAFRFRPLIARDSKSAASRGVEKLKRDVLRQPEQVGA